MSTNFVFSVATLEELLRTHVSDAPVYLDAVEHARCEGNGAFALVRVYVMASDVESGIGRYCRLPIGCFRTIGGEPTDEAKAKTVRSRAAAALQLVKQLIEDGFRLRSVAGQIALPRELQLVDGASERLVFNTASGWFELVEPLPEVA
jgi:hypothetical protein